MAKTELEKHMEELENETSGGAHDAVTFSGKGLGFLRDLFKSKKRDEDENDEDELEDDDLDEDDEDDEEDGKGKKGGRRTKKSANGGELEEEDDEDLEDPGADGEEEIITNHGKRVNRAGAVKKNDRGFDERRFAKNMDAFEEEHEDVLDASDALRDLTKHVRALGKSSAATSAVAEELREQNRLLAKALGESLKSQAALARDIEEIKKQPVGGVPSGFAVLTKADQSGQTRRLSKSDIEDVVTDAMAEGLVEPRAMVRLGNLRSQSELTQFVNDLPAEVQARL